MAYIAKKLTKRSPHHAVHLNALLPGYCCSGNYHASVVMEAHVEDEKLEVWLIVSGADFKSILNQKFSFSAEDLGISSPKR